MKMPLFLWAASLSLLLLLLLLVSVPARLLNYVVPVDQLMMSGLSGTIWDGHASAVRLRLPQGYWHLGSVSWSLEPFSLLLFAPRINVRSDWGNQIFSGDLLLRGKSDLEIYDFEGQMAAGVLRHFAPVALDGLFKLQLSELTLRNGLPTSAQGRLVWQDGAWQSPRGLVPLGSYALDLQQLDGEPLRGEIVTLTGTLEASGGLMLDDRRYSLNILMRSEDELEPQMQEMLGLIATPEGEKYRISVDGNF